MAKVAVPFKFKSLAAISPDTVRLVSVVEPSVDDPEIVKLAPAMLPVEVILDAVEDPMVDEEVVRLVVNILVEVELVIVPLVDVRLVLVILLIVALLDDRLVIVDEAAVVVEKVEVAEKDAGEAVVNVPETYKSVVVAEVKVALVLTKFVNTVERADNKFEIDQLVDVPLVIVAFEEVR